MITLTDGASTIELPDDLVWADEWGWCEADQSFARSVTGAMIIQSAARTGGREITLEPPDNGGWILRSTLEQLQAWAGTPDLEMTLTLRGANYTVMFRPNGGSPIEAKDLFHFTDPLPEHFVVATFKFITV